MTNFSETGAIQYDTITSAGTYALSAYGAAGGSAGPANGRHAGG